MDYKNEFIKFMCASNVLTFGDFVTKSGRKTPYFINTGNYSTGKQIAKLGDFYAKCIEENKIDTNVLFGPAYKGIPLCVSVASCLYHKYEKNVGYAFNRKEKKDHGEGGLLVGHKLKDGDNVTIIEDVITAGTAVREIIPILKNTANINIKGIVISVDRMEKGKNDTSAVQEMYNEYGIKVHSIVTINDIISAIENNVIDGQAYLSKMLQYREKYGI